MSRTVALAVPTLLAAFLPALLAALLVAPSRSAPSNPTPDRRLAKPVTLSVVGTDLGRLAKQLTSQTGVGVRVERDIADEKIDVFVTSYPLGRLQRYITALLGYRWSIAKGTEEKPVYVLFRDENTRKRQDALRALRKERAEIRLAEDVGNIKRLLDMKDEDLEKLPAEERQLAATIRSSPAYRFVLDLNGGDREALYGSGYRADIATLPTDSPLVEDLLTNPVSRVKQSRDQLTHVAVELPGHDGQTGFGRGMNAIVVSLMRDKSTVESRFYPLTKEGMRHIAERPDLELEKAYLRDFRSDGNSQELSDARLAKTLLSDKNAPEQAKGLSRGSVDFHTGCQWIAASTGVPILGDFYTPRQQKALMVEGLPARDAVERLCAWSGHTWTMREGALLFRENNWPNLMPIEVPLSTLEALEEAGDSRKGDRTLLNLDQSILATALTDEQLSHLPAYGWDAPWAGSEQTRAILRFVAALTPEQRARLEGTEGMDLTTLPSGLEELFGRFYEVRWTRNGYAPQVFSARLQRNVQLPGDTLPYTRMTFRVSLNGENRELQLVFPVKPDRGPGNQPDRAARSTDTRPVATSKP